MRLNSSRDMLAPEFGKEAAKPIASFVETKDLLLQGELHPVTAGSALFAIGYELDQQGRRTAADSVYRQTIELLESLSSRHNSNLNLPDLSRLAYYHGRNLFYLGRFRSSMISFLRVVEIIDSLIVLDTSQRQIEFLAETLIWLGCCQRKSGRYAEASLSYERSISLWSNLLALPHNETRVTEFRRHYATALFGYAKTLRHRGRRKESQKHYSEAMRILGSSLSCNSLRQSHKGSPRKRFSAKL